MPKIFEYFGFVFYFFSNEHEPIHVHVALGDCETIFELIMENGELIEIGRRVKKGVDLLSEKDAKTAETFIRKYETNIIEKWINFFVLRKRVRCTIIKKKIGLIMARQLFIQQAVYLSDFLVELEFNDGKIQKVDFRNYLYNHPQYDKYKKPINFKKFFLDHGNIVWGKNWDLIFPIEKLYNGDLTGGKNVESVILNE